MSTDRRQGYRVYLTNHERDLADTFRSFDAALRAAKVTGFQTSIWLMADSTGDVHVASWCPLSGTTYPTKE